MQRNSKSRTSPGDATEGDGRPEAEIFYTFCMRNMYMKTYMALISKWEHRTVRVVLTLAEFHQ